MAVVRIAAAVALQLRAHAAAAYPCEACGLLGGTRLARGVHLDVYLPQNNRAAQRHRFALDPLAILHADARLRASGRALLGVFHSHPDRSATPSAADRAGAWGSLVQVITPVLRGEPRDPRAWSAGGIWAPLPLAIT